MGSSLLNSKQQSLFTGIYFFLPTNEGVRRDGGGGAGRNAACRSALCVCCSPFNTTVAAWLCALYFNTYIYKPSVFFGHPVLSFFFYCPIEELITKILYYFGVLRNWDFFSGSCLVSIFPTHNRLSGLVVECPP